MKKKIAVLIVDRANYGRLLPILKELRNDPNVELQIICSGTMLLDRFGRAERIVEEDGFTISSRVYMELEGSNPVTMAKSIGIAVMEFTNEFQRLAPEILLVIGDRYEAFGAVIGAAYMNICIAHVQGGEVSGSIDECARHAISKFSHYHFPSTERSKEYLIKMGENPETVFNFGCPVVDVIKSMDLMLNEDVFNLGVGATISSEEDYFLVVFHPTTTDYGNQNEKVDELLDALHELEHPTVWLWPNVDAGSDYISRRLRQYREQNGDKWLRLIKNFTPTNFQKVLANAKCAIGNSSSFVRDSTVSGTPVVLVGNRQFGRETGENCIKVECLKSKIKQAIESHLENGRYLESTLYGENGGSKKIARKLMEVDPYNKKFLHYIYE